MNKRFVFFYAFFCIAIIFVFVFWGISSDKVEPKEKEPGVDKKIYAEDYVPDISKKDTSKIIRVKLTDENKIVEMTMDEYLKGVVPAEMPPDYEEEALKAQTIVARTYLCQKMQGNAHSDCDICDNPKHCQAYYSYEKLMNAWERTKKYNKATRDKYYAKVEKCVEDTNGVVVTYNGKYIKAFFHANSGGTTESASAIWGEQDIPYLKSVKSEGENLYKYYETEVKLTKSALQMKINNSLSKQCNIDMESDNTVEILSHTESGRVKNVKIGGTIYKATDLRTALGIKSTNFNVMELDNGMILFKVKGYGHGVGLSQVGANYYAKQGKTYEEIIKHYYTGVNVEKM